jgi:hypothetical protein
MIGVKGTLRKSKHRRRKNGRKNCKKNRRWLGRLRSESKTLVTREEETEERETRDSYSERKKMLVPRQLRSAP